MQFLCSCTMDVLSPANCTVVCIGCLHSRRMILLGAIPHQETLDENVFAAGFFREFYPRLQSLISLPGQIQGNLCLCTLRHPKQDVHHVLVHNSRAWQNGKLFIMCSLFKPGLQKERKIIFLPSLSSDMRVVREHSRCFTAYKCGIVLERIEALQGTLSTKADVWVFCMGFQCIHPLDRPFSDSHRLGIAQIDNEIPPHSSKSISLVLLVGQQLQEKYPVAFSLM